MSLISSLGIAKQALAVNQSAISVVSNNIANVDNEDYSKLRVSLSDVVNYTQLSGSTIQEANSLSGVQLSDITRASDEYLESYCRGQNSEYEYLKEYSTIASRIEDTMNELNETGLMEALSSFYDAANALADDPTDITARQNYVSCAENVCYIFNNVYNSLDGLQESLVGDYTLGGSCNSAEIGTYVDEVNSLLDQLADVNADIIKTNSTSSSSSAMLDQRDALLKDLSSYLPIETEINANNTINVSLGSYDLLRGASVEGYLDADNSSATADAPVQINIVDSDGATIYEDVTDDIDSGIMGAVLTATGSASSSNLTINSVLDNLNTLAETFADELNSLQTGSVTEDGTTTYAMCLSSDYSELVESTESFFLNSETETTSDIDAGNISVNSDIVDNLYLVAAGRKEDTTTSSDVGNNSNMVLISATQNETYSDLDNQTFSDYLSTAVSSIGSDVETLENRLDTQSDVLSSIESTLSSETGVNLDEELSDLIKYQQAYQAAARVFTVCSDLLAELINLGR